MILHRERPQVSEQPGVAARPDSAAPSGSAAETGPAGPSVGTRATHGAFWTAVAFGVTRVSTLVINLLLARLLGPNDMGTVSFAMIFIGVLLLLQDLGVPAAIIYGTRSPREVAGTALTMNVVTALAFTAIVVGASPFLASLGSDPTIGPVVIALSCGLVITAVGSVQNAVLTRDLAFRKKAVPDVAPAVLGGLVAIVFALAGFGVWSLVAGQLVKATGTTLLLWAVSPVRQRPEFRLPVALELFRYGRHASFASILGFVAGNSDFLIVGALMGSYALGVYTLAYNLASIPAVLVTQVVVTVLFPALSAVRERRGEAHRLLAASFHSTVVLSVLLALGIFICAPAYAILFLTERWEEMIAPLQILAAFGVLRSIGSWTAPVFKAMGRPDLEWRLSLVRLVLHVLLMLALAQAGVVGIAASHLIIGAVFVVVGLGLVGRVTEIGAGGIWALVRPHLLAGGAAMLLIAALLATPTGAVALSSVFGSPVVFLATAGAYLGLLAWAAPHILTPLRDRLVRLAGRSRASRSATAVSS